MREGILQPGGGIIHKSLGEEQDGSSQPGEPSPADDQPKGQERSEDGNGQCGQVGIPRRRIHDHQEEHPQRVCV